jgi:hypothetical protein
MEKQKALEISTVNTSSGSLYCGSRFFLLAIKLCLWQVGVGHVSVFLEEKAPTLLQK